MKMISRGFGFFIVITLLTEAQEDKSVSFGLVHNFLNFLTKYLLEKMKIVLLQIVYFGFIRLLLMSLIHRIFKPWRHLGTDT